MPDQPNPNFLYPNLIGRPRTLPRWPAVCIHGLEKCDACNSSYLQTKTQENPKDLIASRKVPLHLIPSSPLARLAVVMQLGAKKYGAYNWRESSVKLTVYLDAAERHLRAILDGESIDEESHQHHAAHVMACMAIILDAYDVGKLIDDRPSPGAFAHVLKELQL